MSSSYPHYTSLLGTSPTSSTLRAGSTLDQVISRARTHPTPRPARSPKRSTAAATSPGGGGGGGGGDRPGADVLDDLDEEASLLPPPALAANGTGYGATVTGGGGRRLSSSSSRRGQRLSVAREGHIPVEGKLPLLDPQVLTAEQGGETALEEEERLLGHPGGGDHGGEADGAERDWREAVKTEARILTLSVLPIMLTQLAEYSLIIVSVISIGHLSVGPIDLAASSLASMTASVSAFSILQGIASSLDTLLPAAWTSSDPSRVGLWTQRVSVIALGAMPMICSVWFNAEAILIFLKQEPEVAHKAAVYLRSLSVGLPGYAANCVLKKYFQAQGKYNVPTVAVLIVAPFNILLNWLLVWGPFPALRLGFTGAPLATACSYNLEAVLFIAYACLSTDKRAWPGFSLSQTFSKLGTCFTLSMAGIGMTASEWWSWEFVTLAASLLGPTALAAQAVLLLTCSVAYQLPFSLSVATSVRAGNLLGAGRAWEAKMASRVALGLAVLIAGSNSAILLAVRHNWARIFNNDPDVVRRVAELLPWLAFFQLSDGLTGVANGILRVLGRQSVGALLNLSAYYVFGLPIGFYLTFRRELGLEGLWIGLSLALLYSAIGAVGLVARADWEREVAKAQERLGAHDPPLPAASSVDDEEQARALLEDVVEEEGDEV